MSAASWATVGCWSVASALLVSCMGTQRSSESFARPRSAALATVSSKNSGVGGEAASSAKPNDTVLHASGEIRRVVTQHLGQIKNCYMAELAVRPGLKGAVTVKWHISQTGGVTAANVESSTLDSPPVEECIVRVVRGWVFENPAGVEADASWGFGFSL